MGLDRLEKGDIDLMPDVAFTEARGKIFTFHSDPALYSWFQVFSRRGSGIRSIPDLDGKRVAVLYRSIQQEIFDRIVRDFGLSVSFVTFSDFESAFQAVADGKADAVITNRFFGAAHMKAYNLEDTAISFNPTRLFFAAPLDADPEILAAIDKHLREMKRNPDSIYFNTLARWTSDQVFMVIPAWLKTIAALLAFLTLLGGVLSFAFKRQADSRAAELTRLFRQRSAWTLLLGERRHDQARQCGGASDARPLQTRISSEKKSKTSSGAAEKERKKQQSTEKRIPRRFMPRAGEKPASRFRLHVSSFL